MTSDQMVTVPAQLLLEVEQFISTHRGITFAEAERAVSALRSYRNDGAALYTQHMEQIAQLKDELKLMHDKLNEVQKQVNGEES